MKKRVRDYSIKLGVLKPGQFNAITDVPNLTVGHCTVHNDDHGCARTGVTAIIPHNHNIYRYKCAAASYVHNGYGKTMGLAQVEELGTIETPLMLTNTLNIGKVADGLISYMVEKNPDLRSVNPLVGECNDGRLNEIEKRFVEQTHVYTALQSAQSGIVAEGCVGAGTGMIAFGYKGGIGTASRVVEVEGKTYTVGALVLANFGRREQLVIDGIPVGRLLIKDEKELDGSGSIVMVVATDAPFDARQLKRLAKRAAMGLARTGSIATNGSGDFVIAFSNTRLYDSELKGEVTTATMIGDGATMSTFFGATVEAVEESIINALFAAEDTIGRDNYTIEALPVEKVLEIMHNYRYGDHFNH